VCGVPTMSCLLAAQIAVAVLWFTRSQLHGEVASIMAAAVVLLLYWKVEAVSGFKSILPACHVATEVLDMQMDMRSMLLRLRWHSLLLALLLMFSCLASQVQFYARAFLPLKHRCRRRQAASVCAAAFACVRTSVLSMRRLC
jgi:hypothetical protein